MSRRIRQPSIDMAVAVAWTDTHLGTNSLDERMIWMLDGFLDQMLNDIHPDVAICLGDIFNSKKPTSLVIEYATLWFKKLSDNVEHVLLIPGNHDIDATTGSTSIDYLDDIASNIHIFYEPIDFMDMLFVPYYRYLDPDTRKKIASHPQVFLHQGISSATLYGSRLYGNRPDAVTPEELCNKDLALCGHIHTPMYWDQSNVYLLGAPYQTRYVDPMLERGFGCWTLEDPSDFQVIPFHRNFYLNKLNVVIEGGQNVMDNLLKALPSPAENTYYQVQLSVEGAIKHKQAEECRKCIQETYAGVLDGMSIVSVLPPEKRSFFQALKTASMLRADQAPQEMLSAYMEGTSSAYYKSNPVLREMILGEFGDIASTIAEAGAR